jgi:hypothetical protein
LARAKAAFEHAIATDSTIALNRDASRYVHRGRCRLARFEDVGAARHRVSSLSGRAEEPARATRAPVRRRRAAAGGRWALQGVAIAQQELDSLLWQFDRVGQGHLDHHRRLLDDWSIAAAIMGGRATRAAELLRRVYGADTSAVDLLLLSYGSSTPVAESRVLRSVQVAGKVQEHPEGCNVALARLRRGDTTDAASILATEPPMDDKLPASEVVMTVRRGPVAQAAIWPSARGFSRRSLRAATRGCFVPIP